MLIYLSKEPMVNDTQAFVQFPFGVTPKVDHRTLWQYFKNSPEVVAICKAIVEDILSDGGRIISIHDGEAGKIKKRRAETFWEENRMKELLASFLFDVLVTGDGYLYKVKPSENQVRNAISNIIDKYPFQYKSNISDLLHIEMKSVENIYQTKNIRLVPSSTMKIKYDIHGMVSSYIQRVGAATAHFSPEEIVHFSFMKVDGEVYGFTPLGTIFKELDILSNIKDYEKYFFEKGGVPNHIFIFKNETPESPTYKNFIKQLQTYASLQNKWKSMSLTGEVDVKDLNRMSKDMEFPELSRFVVQVLVMTWGVPSSRLSDLLVTKGMRASQVSTEGYYRQISHYQDLLEDLINSEILNEFGVKWKFNRTYKQDEVREVQIKTMNTDAINKQMAILAKYGKRLTEQQILRELDLNDDEVEKATPEELNINYPNDRQGQLPNKLLMPQSSETIAQNQDKHDAAIESDSTPKKFNTL